MPVRKIFFDNGQKLEAYVNDKAKLFVAVGPEDDDGTGPYNGFITLDRSDLDELIDLLMSLKDEVFDESEFEDESAKAAGQDIG